MTPPASFTAGDPLQSLAYDGLQQPLETLDHDIAAAGNDPAKFAPIAHRLIALLHSPATTFAARQAICQRLGEFPAALLTPDEARPVFAAMLADEKQIDLARLALERVPGEQIDKLFLQVLDIYTPGMRVELVDPAFLQALQNSLKNSASAPLRLALVQSTGNRHLTAAIPLLAPLLKENDPAVATAAAKALSQIATHAALDALNTAPDPTAPFIVEAKLTVAHALPAPDATQIFLDIRQTPKIAANLRAAALHGLLTTEPETAPSRIVTALQSDDAIQRPVVLEATATHPAKNLTHILASELPGFDAPTQAAVIAALGRRGDPAATRTIAAAANHSDPSVRAAAIVALGELPGTPDTATLLASIIAKGDPADAKLARQSLARLNGPGVADTIATGATSAAAAPALRIVFLEQLAARDMTESVPLLFQTRSDPDAAIRAAALGSLAELAPASAQPAILDWARAAADPTEQSRALRALASVSLRNSDTAARARPIIDAIDHAPPALAARLLPILPRLADPASAACAAHLAQLDDPDLSSAAIATLARWPDATGLDPLIAVTEHAPRESVRAAAAQAALRFLEQNRRLPSAELAAMIGRLLDAAREDPPRIQLLRLLGRGRDDTALALAEKFQRDSALAAEANDAALAIRANRAGPPSLRASDHTGQLTTILDGNLGTHWAVAATAGQWLELDFHSTRPIHRLTLDQAGGPDDFPPHYEIFITDDPQNPGPARASGSGQPKKTIIDLTAARGRYVIIRQTATRNGGFWRISELLVD